MERTFRYLPYFLLLVIFALTRALGLDGYYGQDAYEYLRLTRALADHFLRQGPAAEGFYPPVFPLSGVLAGMITGDPEVGLGLVSLISAMAVCALFRLSLNELYEGRIREKDVFLVLVLLLSPAFLKASQVCMSDGPAAALVMGTVYSVLLYRRTATSWLVIVGLLCAVLAGYTRLANLALLPFPLAFGLILALRNRHFPALTVGLLLSAGLAYGLSGLISSPELKGIGHPYSPSQWSLGYFLKWEYETLNGKLHYTMPNLLFALGGVFLHQAYQFWGIVFLIAGLRRSEASQPFWRWAWVPVVVYLVFLAGLPFQNERYFLPVFPWVLLLLFPGFAWLWGRVMSWKAGVVLLAGYLSLLLFFDYRALRVPVKQSRWEQAMAAELQPFRQRTVYSFSVDIALAQKIPGMTFRNLWTERYSRFDTTALVLFNETEFKKTWEGHNPMLNWEALKTQQVLRPVKSLPKGWMLYEID